MNTTNNKQAGAVAVRCRVRGEQAWWYRSPDSFDPSHNQHLIEHEYLYPTPPAAVPVEALEGLVADWKLRHGSNKFIDELTQLIKERSNG